MAKASLAVTFVCLDKSIADSVELHRLLAEVQGQREKDLAEARVALGEVEVRATKEEKAHEKAKAKGVGADARVISTKAKAMKAEVRA